MKFSYHLLFEVWCLRDNVHNPRFLHRCTNFISPSYKAAHKAAHSVLSLYLSPCLSVYVAMIPFLHWSLLLIFYVAFPHPFVSCTREIKFLSSISNHSTSYIGIFRVRRCTGHFYLQAFSQFHLNFLTMPPLLRYFL